MRKQFFVIGITIGVFLLLFGIRLMVINLEATKPAVVKTVKPFPTDSMPTASMKKVNLYFVALNDNGKSGFGIDCGDSIIAVPYTISSTVEPLQAVIEKEFSIKNQYYSGTNLYNPFYLSNLSVVELRLRKKILTIRLSGDFSVNGKCDYERIKGVLLQTSTQFEGIGNIEIIINDKNITDYINESIN